MITDVICGVMAPFYIVSLLVMTDLSFTLFILFLCYLSFLILDFFMFACACIATGKTNYWRLWPFMVIYGPFKGYVMRFARLYTYAEEWIYSASRSDNFAPPKVNDWIRWK
jgi:hypothetical protein